MAEGPRQRSGRREWPRALGGWPHDLCCGVGHAVVLSSVARHDAAEARRGAARLSRRQHSLGARRLADRRRSRHAGVESREDRPEYARRATTSRSGRHGGVQRGHCARRGWRRVLGRLVPRQPHRDLAGAVTPKGLDAMDTLRRVEWLAAVVVVAALAAPPLKLAAQEPTSQPTAEMTEQQRLRAQSPGGGLTPGVALPAWPQSAGRPVSPVSDAMLA